MDYIDEDVKARIDSLDGSTVASFADGYLQDPACVKICQALEHNHSIRELDLKGNDLRETAANALADLLRTNSCIEVLRLEWNYLGSRECLVPLLDSLSSNRTLLELDLRNNQIGPEGGELIAAMLRKNHTIEHLDLRWNNLGSSGAQAISSALDSNSTLKQCLLPGNGVSRDILTAIGNYAQRNRQSAGKVHEEIVVARLPMKSVNMHVISTNVMPKKESKEQAMQTSMLQEEMQELAHKYKASNESNKELQAALERAASQQSSEIDALKQVIEQERAIVVEERAARQNLEVEKKALIDEISNLSANLEDLSKRNSANLVLEHERTSSLKKEVVKLTQEIETARARQREDLQSLKSKLEHEMHMREVEKEMAVQLNAKLKQEMEEELKKVRHEEEARRKLEEARMQGVQEEKARAEADAQHTRQQLVSVQIEHEERFAEFESSLREQHANEFNSKLALVEERLAQIQSSRDAFQAKDALQRQEFAEMLRKAELERKEYERWLDDEKKARVDEQTKTRSLQIELDHARTLLRQKEQQVDAAQARLRDAERQRENLRHDHEATLEKVLSTHTQELTLMETRLRDTDNDLNALRQRARAAELIAARLQEEKLRREHGLRTALDGLRRCFDEPNAAERPGSMLAPKARRTRVENRPKTHLAAGDTDPARKNGAEQ